jgi:hypothetical protein
MISELYSNAEKSFPPNKFWFANVDVLELGLNASNVNYDTVFNLT